MIKHGGNIEAAVIKYGIEKNNWLDLSTGLNPMPWKTNLPIPDDYYQTLPQPDVAFYSIACRYYKAQNLLAVAGSQAAIQAIPRLLANKKVALPVPGYEEHLYHWQQNKHQCLTYNPDSVNLVDWVAEHQPDVVVVINPNNPSCKLHTKNELLSVLSMMEKQNGLLIIDEAFLDTQPNLSLLHVESKHLIVLRSLGKFFGLPGIRMGFVKASEQWRNRLEEYLGAWPLNGPSLWIATQCLADLDWQLQAQEKLKISSQQQLNFLEQSLPFEWASTDFFMSFHTTLELAHYIQDFYAREGILVRLVDLTSTEDNHEAIIRFGLCAEQAKKHFERVTKALSRALIARAELSLSAL